MTIDEISQKVKQIVSELSGVSADSILETSSLSDDLNLDDLDTIQLTMLLEDAFEVEIPDETMYSYKTISDVIKSIVEAKV